MTLKLGIAALVCSVAILAGAAAAYYFRVWPAPLLLPLLQTTTPAETAPTARPDRVPARR
jgi:hypothetical protein